MITLTDWQDRQRAHEQRVQRLVADHEARRAGGIRHPVEDFLFTYYAFRPNQLRRWHPGVGRAIASTDAPQAGWPLYRTDERVGTTVDAAAFTRRHGVLLQTVQRLLRATAQRPASFGCFGMHEWAMVYRLAPDDVRHGSVPLRFAPERIASIVEGRRLQCTHFDAYRFFTAAAQPRNAHRLSRTDQVEHEQPGCLHAGMDLYKWAYKLTPAVPSELVLDAFELARDIRYVDMRASPYDLAELQLAPIAVETPAGRAEYVEQQRALARRAAPLRAALLAVCDRLSAAAGAEALG